MNWVPDDHEFALCLTHDVDRPYKSTQAPYHALRDRSLHHLRALHPDVNPWWQFDRIMRIEEDLGVRSAFYFLSERHLLERTPREWLDSDYWIEHLGRYDIAASDIADLIHELDEKGWEVGLHASLGTHEDIDRLRTEKEYLEEVVGSAVTGVRHHWLRIDPTTTWRFHRELGFRYDASLGSSTEVGFGNGYYPHRPFDDDFVVFPLTAMDKTLHALSDSPEGMIEICEDLLDEAAANDAVMTILWHPRNFCETDYPGHARVYRRVIEEAKARDAWVGPPEELYEQIVERRLEIK